MKKTICVIVILLQLLCFGQAWGQQKYKNVAEYISIFKDIAIREMERSGIPASITLAQGIHESGFGNSNLAQSANNHFGIKCGNDWKGDNYQKISDDTMVSCFRKYGSPEESYIDHTELLLKRKNYKFLFEYKRTDYKNWAHGLRKAGYASDPKYPEKLISTIEKNELQKYDTMAVAYIVFDDNNLDDNDETVINGDNSSTRALRRKPRSFLFAAYRKGFFRQNNASYVVAQKGESPLAAAARFGIPYQRFLRFNDLKDGDQLIEYQYIYIQPKKSSYKGDTKTHKIEADETIYEIAQYYGIRMTAILQRNLLKEGEEPARGEIVLLAEKAPARPRLRAKNHIDSLPAIHIGNNNPTGVDSAQLELPHVRNDVRPDTNTIFRPTPKPIDLNTPAHDPNNKPINTTRAEDTSKQIKPNPPTPPRKTPATDTTNNQKPNPNVFNPPTPPTPPKPTPPTPPKPTPPTPPKPTPPVVGKNARKHVVKSGDTLSRLATQYKTTIAEIKKLNKMKTDNIYVGQTLIVP
jgi:LysM repeat protein